MQALAPMIVYVVTTFTVQFIEFLISRTVETPTAGSNRSSAFNGSPPSGYRPEGGAYSVTLSRLNYIIGQ